MRRRGRRAAVLTPVPPGTTPATRVVRDRTTWLVYALNGLYGWFLYAFTPAVALLRDEQGYARAVAGLHGTSLAAGAITSGLLQARVVGRVGRARALWGGGAGVVVGAVLFCSATALPVTLLGAYVAGSCGGLVLNTVVAVLTDHQGAAAPAAITETNAGAAAVGVVAPLALGAAVATGVGWRPALLLLVPATLVLWLACRRVPVPDARPHPAGGSGAPARLPRRFWGAWRRSSRSSGSSSA